MVQIVSLNGTGQVQQARVCTLITVQTQVPRKVEIQLSTQDNYNTVAGWEGTGQVRDDQGNVYIVNLAEKVVNQVNRHITYEW